MTVAEFQAAFPGYTDIAIIPIPSGQKDVAYAKQGGTEVALKVFKPVTGDEVKRVDREIAAVAKLNSNYVPAVFESGQKDIAGTGRYFIVEQFIRGTSYHEVLQKGAQSAPDLESLLDALIKACVDFSTVDVVHRDLKPANLIIDAAGKIWVIDFGFCRHLDLSGVTPTGQGVGTIGYSPLEQLRVIDATIDIRADIFSAGVIAYEAASGAPNPWRAGISHAQQYVERLKAQELPRLTIAGDRENAISDFIAWLTQRFPSRRPQNGAEALAALASMHERLAEP